ncbi:MAG: hypothetical protein ACE361_02400 [Aureliella sp.]
MFRFLVRRPEVMVNIWQIMGITKVTAQRLNPYSFNANDGVGTACRCDLVYSADNLHIYLGDGDYDGSMAPRRVTGNCVCILRTYNAKTDSGDSVVRGTMDVFLKLDNFGADLLAKSVAPFVGKTADYNFVETAKFIGQISNVCVRSPVGAQNLAARLTSIQPNVQREFAKIAASIAAERLNAMYNSAKLAQDSERLNRLTLGQEPNSSEVVSKPAQPTSNPQWRASSKTPPYPTGAPMMERTPSPSSKYSARMSAPSNIAAESISASDSRTTVPDLQPSSTLTFSDSSNRNTNREIKEQPSAARVPSWIAPRKQNIFMRR